MTEDELAQRDQERFRERARILIERWQGTLDLLAEDD